MLLDSSVMAPMPGSRTTATMTEDEMERVISEISSSRARTDLPACIDTLNPLLNTTEGRAFLSKQEGENASVLIGLFDWALKSRGIPFNKGYILSTLRQLCACRETLPESYVLPIEFNSTDPYHAAGGFADVWKGSYNGREVAFKSIRGSTLSDNRARLKCKRRFCKEVILWKSLNHPNILGLIGVCRWENKSDARLTMVSEWMTNGNIMEYIKRNDCQRMRLLVDCAMGVKYLHDMNLVHGDLKGANILVTSDDPVRARLADFGFMTIVYDSVGGPENTSALAGGTIPFMAPELLCPTMFGKTKCRVSKEADVYAFGMVILQVLSGLVPFHHLRDTEISYNVIQGKRPEVPTNASESGISDGLWELLAKCWNADYSKRPQINEIHQHLSHEPTMGSIFLPSNFSRTPSCESVFDSGTQRYADIFVTARMEVPTEEYPPFPMPLSPIDVTESSSHETQNPTSLFSAGTQDVSPFTTPGNSQIRAKEPKPPTSETPSWTILDRNDFSTITEDSAYDPTAFKNVRQRGAVSSPLPRGSGPLQHDHDKDQHDPTIDDAPHVGLTPVPARGVPHSSSPRPDPSEGKLILPKIVTNTQLESRNSDSPGTAFYTPGGSGEVVDRRPFDSAVNVQVVYSRSGSRSQDVAGPIRRVVDVHQPVDKWETKYQFPTPGLPSPRRNSKTSDDGPRHGLRMPLTRPLQVNRERRGDSIFSFSSSPFDEFRRDAGPSRRISEANTSTIIERESRCCPKSKLSAGDDIYGGKGTKFLRQNGKEVVPRRDSEGRSEDDHGEGGKERDDHSHLSTGSTDYLSVWSEVEEYSQDQNSTPHPSSNPSLVKQLLVKLGVRKSSQLSPSSPSKRPQPRAQNNTSAASMAPTTTGSADTPAVGPSHDRGRTLSGLSSFVNLRPGPSKTKGNRNKREVKLSIMNFFGDHVGPFG